jgi:hypothetical protein
MCVNMPKLKISFIFIAIHFSIKTFILNVAKISFFSSLDHSSDLSWNIEKKKLLTLIVGTTLINVTTLIILNALVNNAKND